MRGRKEEKVLDRAREYIVDEKPLHAIQLYRQLMRGRYFIREAHIELSNLYKYLSRLREAESILLQFLMLNPDDSEIIFRLAFLYFLEKNYLLAEHYIQKAINLSPTSPHILDLMHRIQQTK